MKIPFNKPVLWGSELRYIADAVRRGQLSGDGYYTGQCQAILRRTVRAEEVLLTSSCTHALELAFLLLDIRPGDEVIVPSFTFPSTSNAFVLRGARPVFIDIRPDTLNMNEQLLESLVTSRTRAIVPVHYAGVPCQMDVIERVAHKHNLAVVEDAAQALGASFRGRPAGGMGVLNALSFHETKNCQCGEGGALLIQDPRYRKRAEILRQKGTNRAQYFRGEVDKYSWVDIGSSYVPSELQAAYLYSQLEHLKQIKAVRQRLYDRYFDALEPFEHQGKLRRPYIPPDCNSSHHAFYILLNSERERDRVIQGLQKKNIHAVFHYFPLHASTMGKQFGYRSGACPVSEIVSRRLVRLPLYNSMTVHEQRYVLETLGKLL